MSIGLGDAQPAQPSMFDPPVAPIRPVNPYAPTGWSKKQRIEFDIEMPSGQLCRIMRFERDDLFRLGLMEYLDTFTPALLGEVMDEQQAQIQIRQQLNENPTALGNMLTAIDKVVMAAAVKPQITDDVSLVNYGTEDDWIKPDFVATVHIDDIIMEERMFIFGAAFGKSMDDLKSVFGEAQGLGSLADITNVPPTA